MIKETNTRIIITVSKDQAAWLHKTAKKLNMSVSKLIKWLMDKNISRLLTFLTDEERKVLFKLAKTPWIKLYDEEGDPVPQKQENITNHEKEVLEYLLK